MHIKYIMKLITKVVVVFFIFVDTRGAAIVYPWK